MRCKLSRLALAGVVLMFLAVQVRSDTALVMRVSPTRVRSAPGWLEVRATIEASPDNRTLAVVVESDDFYRSSELQLDGERAPHVNQVLFKDLPAGQYAVTVTLVGVQGRRAVESQWFQVAPGIRR
jgi:hypothetical protein